MEKQSELRLCQECGAPINGRSDKKFCSDMCRTAANNKLKSEHLHNSASSVKAVNFILRNNHKILSNLSKKSVEFTLMYLRDLGFSFRYLTSVEHKEEAIINYCYDFGYIVNQDTVGY
jgi:hypothetical protein